MIKNSGVAGTILFLLLRFTFVNAQSVLTVDDAVSVALKNNFDIQIEKNKAAINQNNNTIGNAGMLPKVDLNAAYNRASNDTKQNFSSGLTVDKNGVESTGISAGVYLNWTIFDGLKMFATRNRLQELEAMGELNLKISIENTVQQVMTVYYNLVSQQQVLNGIRENRSIAAERVEISKKKMDIGLGSLLDLNQAKIDCNSFNSQYLLQEQVLLELKTDLNVAMGQKSDQSFEVADSIPFVPQMKLNDVVSKLENSNQQLLLMQRQQSISQFQLKETRAQYFPKLSVNANYLFARSENQAGFTLLNQNLGLNYGLTASWTIFNGWNTVNQVKNARLSIQNAEIEYKQAKALTDAQVLKSFQEYTLSQQLLSQEEDNMDLVNSTVKIALEQYRLGTITAVDLKQIQQSMADAQSRLANARYKTKLAEIALLKLQGNLLK